ncbi:MAG: 3-deoxy-manno-octulosonate cytidylyltransferase [Gammaproteobacteria bacterium]|nr:3-deoxy-manno-octulosonate cytidylyltransferase [Gammaproteobacteria bacterium]
MSVRVVIPARYGSSRLPGKPLVEIAGKPLVCHVCERGLESRAEEVWLATDDERIAAAVEDMPVRVALTSGVHASGTDRIAEVAARENWEDEDIVVNLQGDEPLMPADAIDAVAASLQANPEAEMATLAVRLYEAELFADPHVVKLVTDTNGDALYFSRAPIPRPREADRELPAEALRHVGLYAYRVAALARLAAEPPCAMEREEGLEQLRALWLGMRIRVEVADEIPMTSVDTAKDIARTERWLDGQTPET